MRMMQTICLSSYSSKFGLIVVHTLLIHFNTLQIFIHTFLFVIVSYIEYVIQTVRCVASLRIPTA